MLNPSTTHRAVDGSSLAVVRIAVGTAAVVAVVRLWANGWLDALYAPPNRLAYPGLGWVPGLDVDGLHLLAVVIVAAGVGTALGWRTRFAAAALALSFTWLEFLEATTYLNHYWFLSSMALLLAVVPSGAALSLDGRRSGGAVPVWSVWAVRAQVAVVYVFAGVAKLSPDWLFDWMPLRLWLPARSNLPVLGPLLAHPAAAAVASWAGAIFDLGVVWLLLHRKTRAWAWGAVVVFHLVTWGLFPSIGIFPWVMMACSTVFFEPDWPRRLLRRPASLVTVPQRNWVFYVACALIAFQVLVPLRGRVGGADPRVSGEGFRFAWNVLAVERVGTVDFVVTEDGHDRLVDLSEWFTENQLRTLPVEPNLILQAAHIVAADLGDDVEVRAESWLSVNGGPRLRLLDPAVDLASLDTDAGTAAYLARAPSP